MAIVGGIGVFVVNRLVEKIIPEGFPEIVYRILNLGIPFSVG